LANLGGRWAFWVVVISQIQNVEEVISPESLQVGSLSRNVVCAGLLQARNVVVVVLSNHINEILQTGEWRGICRQMFVDNIPCDSKGDTSPLANMEFVY
jgi:hypothetical protein